MSTTTSTAKTPRERMGELWRRGGVLIALIILSGVFALLSPRFLTINNWLNVLLQTATIGVVAIGMTFVIVTAGIDLSVGSVVALSGMVAAVAMRAGASGPVGILVALVTGGLVGLFNGISITRLGVTPFIATLATLAMGRGLTLAISSGQTIFDFPPSFTFIGDGKIASIPMPVIILLLAFLIAHFVLSRTVFGHNVYAVGGNREAAHLAGINTTRTEMLVYVIAGVLAGLSGIILTGRLDAALPTSATGLELNAIAAVVIGGASLFGGKGTMLGTLLGALTIGVLANGLNLLNVSPFWTQFIQGAVIFLAVLNDSLNQRKKH